jgi:DNA polymerase-3 subunit delta'
MNIELSGLTEVSAPLPWHQDTWLQLGRQLDDGRLPHALLFAGPEGTGKGQLVLALARLLLCARPEGGFNCGHCHPCRLSAGGSHGDFRWVQPEDKSRVIKIDQVRQAVSFINQTAAFGSRKVVVFYPADSMNIHAANALLKALEEPVADTFLMLVCHRVQGVPPTVRSRCQSLRLASPNRQQSITWLEQRAGDGSDVEQLLTLVDDKPLLAERLLREGRAESLAAALAAVRGVFSGQLTAVEAAGLVQDVELSEFLAQLQGAVHRLLRGQDGRIGRGQARAAFALDDELTRLRGALEAGANPNASLLVEAMLARCERELGAVPTGDNMSG